MKYSGSYIGTSTRHENTPNVVWTGGEIKGPSNLFQKPYRRWWLFWMRVHDVVIKIAGSPH
jgi:hypothetical protein